MSDLLRSMADKIDGMEQGGQASLEPVNHTSVDDTDGTSMMPPLQQKLELLKKAVAVPNAFDSEQGAEPDELDQMKQRAGISPVIIDGAAEDNDITG